MPLWGPKDQANDAPKWGAELVRAGSGNLNKAANNTTMYKNTTLGTFIPNEIDSLVYVTLTMIAAGTRVSGGPGWYFKKQGSGGRNGRVSYESLVAFSTVGSSSSIAVMVPPSLDFSQVQNGQYVASFG